MTPLDKARDKIRESVHGPIISFSNQYFFLSNFYPVPIIYMGMQFQSTEAAYQAAKFHDPELRAAMQHLGPKVAKNFAYAASRHFRLDWNMPNETDGELVKVGVMRDVLKLKFLGYDDHLTKCLRATGDRELIEGNHHGDTYWGKVDGVGTNMLGQLLMQRRDEIS